MDSDMPNFDEDAADHLTNLSGHDISFLVSDGSNDANFPLGADDQSQSVSFDALFQNSVQSLPPPTSMFDIDQSVGSLQFGVAAFIPPPSGIAPLQPSQQGGGFLPSLSSINNTDCLGVLPSLPSIVGALGPKRSRTCSFYFDDLTPARAPSFIKEMVAKLCAVQKSGTTNGAKLDRNPTFFVDAFTSHKVPVVGVWVLLTSSSSNNEKWARVCKTIGATSLRLIPQNHGSGRLTHSYQFIAQQFGLADDDNQMFRNVVICDVLPEVPPFLFLLSGCCCFL
jgi:hypothetical protein